MRRTREKKGITLIALVITVIVLLILAAVSIATLTGENGILTKANNAKTETSEADEREAISLAYNGAMVEIKGQAVTADILKTELITNNGRTDVECVEGEDPIVVTFKSGRIYKVKSDGTFLQLSDVENAKTKQTVFVDNTTIQDSFGNSITIPAGFKIASDSATDVTGGIVIEDAFYTNTIGSQFVWIPVGIVYTNVERTTSKTINLDRYTFADDGTPTAQGTNTIDSYFQELSSSSYGNAVAKNLQGFINSATNNHGYYLGRYEAGIDTERTSSSDDLAQIKVEYNKNVYNYVTQLQASNLSQGMYSSTKFVSDLVNSYAWDTALIFIQEFSGDRDYSRQVRLQTSLVNTGLATDGTNKDVKCNIYDMAGNAVECTTETAYNGYCTFSVRGGYYFSDGPNPNSRMAYPMEGSSQFRSNVPISFVLVGLWCENRY